MPSYKLVWHGSQDDMNTLSDVMSEVIYPPADAVSLTKDDAVKSDCDTDWSLSAYFENQPDLAVINSIVAESGISGEPSFEELPDQDWVAHALKGLGMVQCGRFILHGAHDRIEPLDVPAIVPIEIEANQAFGTGHHPTTAGCLEVLDRIAEHEPKNILDLGTGSAILAIAAAKIWSSHILATDIDATSVEIAAENATRNGVNDLDCATAAGFDHATIKDAAPFDFVFANILAGPLVELAPEMATHTSSGATVLLAGLLAEQEARVTAAYIENGFTLSTRHAHDTWPVLVFKKN